ncbi:MAG: recombinase family protein [Ruminococcus sp.]|nr:recombinase family protein [Ruminococcus sp.]
MSKIGYIRVSTEHQETARQQEIMRGYQVDRIFSEKISREQKQMAVICDTRI